MSTNYQWTAASSLADTSFAGTYTKIVTIPKEAIAMRVVTTLDASCMLSLDTGVTDNLPVTKTSDNHPEIIPLIPEENESQSSHVGKDVMVKDIGTATTGSIYVSFLVRA